MLFLLLGLLQAPALAQGPPAAAVVQQEVLPALTARTQRANARIAAAEAWFTGASAFEASWPAWAGADVLDPAFLRAQRRRMATEGEARAAERIATLPDDPRLARTLSLARTEALDAEDRFASLEERLIAGLSAGIARAPELTPARMRSRLDGFDEILAAAPEEATEEQQAAAAKALEHKSDILAVQRAAVRDFTIAADGSLARWASEAVTSPIAVETLRTLQAVEPVLGVELQAQVKEVLAQESERIEAEQAAARAAELEKLKATLESPPPLTEADTEEALQATVDAAKAAMEAADETVQEVRAIELAIAERRLAIRQGSEAEDASAARGRAEAAREAEEATRAAGERESKALSALRDKVLALQGAVADVYEQEAERRERREQELLAIRQELDARIEGGANAMALSVIDPGRQSAIDAAYLDLRGSVRSLYEELDALRLLAIEHSQDSAERLALTEGWTAGRGSAELAKLDDAFQAASQELTESLENRDRHVDATRDETYRLLDVARDSRRELRTNASSAAKAQARRDFFPELRRELLALPGQVSAGARGVALSLLAIPSFLSNVDALWGIVRGSFELFILVGLWGVGRRQMRVLTERALDAVQLRLGAPLEGEREPSVDQLTALGIALLDVFTLLILFGRLSESLDAFGLFVLLWIGRAALTAAPLIARTSLASPEHMHPAVRIVTPPTEALAAKSMWWFALWLAGSKIGVYAMVVLFDADRMRDVVSSMSSVMFWSLVGAGILAWGPVASSTLAKQAEHSALTGWAASAAEAAGISKVLAFPKYLTSIAVVGGQFSVHIFNQLIEGRAAFGWLQSALARRQLKSEEKEEVARPPVNLAIQDRLTQAEASGISRPEVEARIQSNYGAWRKAKKRGLISIIGDGGSGKSLLMAKLPRLLETEVRTVVVPHRLPTEEQLTTFLAKQLGVVATNMAQLTEAVAELESSVIAIDRAHLLFLRCVRGYAPLQALVALMTATADKHFWVLSIHEPSWNYLVGIAARLKLDAFRDHIRLAEPGGPELAAWLEAQTNPDGTTQISYDALATTGLLGGDEGLAQRRARTAFWRLLSDSAGGIPRNAVQLWKTSLSQPSAEQLEVHMFEAPRANDIQDLSDDLLFVLTALVHHEVLTADELARVLNQRAGAARSSVKHLVNLELATYDPNDLTYRLPVLWVPAIAQLLRQKHFLYSE